MVDTSAYKDFLLKYLDLLETLSKKSKTVPDPKFICELRIAERSLNFFLNNFPLEKINATFGIDPWTDLKKRRDELAGEISDIIEQDERTKKRYESFCDNLKKARLLGSLL